MICFINVLSYSPLNHKAWYFSLENILNLYKKLNSPDGILVFSSLKSISRNLLCVCVYIYMYTHIHTYDMYVCIYVCIYTYIDTYIQYVVVYKYAKYWHMFLKGMLLFFLICHFHFLMYFYLSISVFYSLSLAQKWHI